MRWLLGIEGGKQGRGTVALAIVGHCAAAALLHRQPWLGAVQSLNLALVTHLRMHGLRSQARILCE